MDQTQKLPGLFPRFQDSLAFYISVQHSSHSPPPQKKKIHNLIWNFEKSFYLFLSHLYAVEKLFLGQIFEIEIFMDSHVLRGPESEKYIFTSVCVYYQHNSKNKITVETSNLVFCIVSRTDATWNFSWRSDKNCVQGHTQKIVLRDDGQLSSCRTWACRGIILRGGLSKGS